MNRREEIFSIAGNVAKAIAAASAARVIIEEPRSSLAIHVPIFQWAAETSEIGALNVIGLIYLGILFFRGPTSSVLSFGAAMVGFAWLGIYSATNVYLPHVFFTLLFFSGTGIITNSESEGTREISLQKLGALMIAVFFLASGIQKCNANYLSGAKFIGYIAENYALFKFIEFPAGLRIETLLAQLNVALEFSIGLGALFRPKLFLHFAAIYALASALFYPQAMVLYFAVAPFFLIIVPEFCRHVATVRMRSVFENEFFWIFTLLFTRLFNDPTDSSVSLSIYQRALPALFIAVHAWFLMRNFSEARKFSQTPFDSGFRNLIRNKFVSMAVLLAFLSPILSQFGAPAPIGFSGFSGKPVPESAYQIEFEDELLCESIKRRAKIFSTNDAKLNIEQSSRCQITGPTESGIRFVLSKICQEVPATTKIQKSNIRVKRVSEVEWQSVACTPQ